MNRQPSNFDDFDPYHKWLGIPKGKRPPTLYQLLGISPNETDVEVIAAAVKRQQVFVTEFQGGPHHDSAAFLLSELERARSVLLDGAKRRKYDQRLRDARERRKGSAEGTSVIFGSGSRWIGEENSIVKPFAGIVVVICIAFAGMAIFSFKVLPWSKQPEKNEVAASQLPAQVAQADVEPQAQPARNVQEQPIKEAEESSNTAKEPIAADSQSVTSFTSLFDGNSLNGWVATPFRDHGAVTVNNGNISLGTSNGSTGITWKKDFPKLDYELILDAKRVAGNDFFCGLTFPVADSTCSLIVGGWGGTVVGLSSIDGRDASQNETTKNMPFEKDRWYAIRLCVTANRIKIWIDDSQVIDQSTAGHRISIRPEVELSKPLGICSWKTTAALRSIKWRPLKK